MTPFIQFRETYWNKSFPTLQDCFFCTLDHNMILFPFSSHFQSTPHIVASRNLHPLLCKVNDNTFRLDNVIPNQETTIHILYNVKLARNLGKASVVDIREKDVQDKGFLRQVHLVSNAFDVDRRIGVSSLASRLGDGLDDRFID